MVWKSVWHNWQKWVLEKLQKNPSHAYLFSWPRWIWKLQVAKDFWKNLLYSWVNDNEISRQIDLNIYPDFVILDKLWVEWSLTDFDEISKYTNVSQNHRHKGSSNAKTNTISIDDIHEIIKEANKSSIWKRKIIIISDIERMNVNAFNALLKTLEDPPSFTNFICTTSNSSILSQTIISRFQEIKFNFMPSSEINKFLKTKYNDKLTSDQMNEISEFSFWRIHSAIKFAKNLSELSLARQLFKEVSVIYNNWSLISKLKRAWVVSQDLKLFEQEIEIWFYYLRSRFYDKQSNMESWSKALNALISLVLDLKSNVNKKLALENYYLNI